MDRQIVGWQGRPGVMLVTEKRILVKIGSGLGRARTGCHMVWPNLMDGTYVFRWLVMSAGKSGCSTDRTHEAGATDVLEWNQRSVLSKSIINGLVQICALTMACFYGKISM